DAELLGDTAGVVDLGDRAATGVDVGFPQAHRDTDHLMARLEQQRRGNRGVDAARHGGQDSHRPSAASRAAFGGAQLRAVAVELRSPPAAQRPSADRRRSTDAGTTSRAWSTPASVVVAPSDRRNAPMARAAGTAIAVSPWDGAPAPPVHPEPPA